MPSSLRHTMVRASFCLGCASALVLTGACVGDDPSITGGDSDGGSNDGASGPGDGGGAGDGASDASSTGDAGPPPAPRNEVSWAHYEPTAGDDGTFVAMDSSGYAVVVQNYIEQPPDVPKADYGGVYVTRLDPLGKVVWKKGVPTQGTPPAVRLAVTGVAVDADGDAYVVGSTQGALDFGGGVVVPGGGQYKDVGWVVKLDRASGTGVWMRTFRSSTSQVGIGGIAARNDALAIIGNFYDDLSYEKTTGEAKESGTGSFVARLDRATGKTTWLSTGRNAKQIILGGITIDASGAVYAGLWFDAPITGWGNPSPVSTASDGLVVAFEATGNVRWKKVFGKAGSTTYGSVKALAWNAGTLALVGRTPAGIDFGDGKPLGTSGASDPYVAALDPATGALRWARAIGNDEQGDDDEALTGVTVDDWGQVIVSGRYRKTLVIAGKALPKPPSDLATAAFGAKLDSAGTFVWSKAILSTTWASAESISAGPGGNMAVTVALNGTADLGGGVTATTATYNKSLGVVGWTP